MKVMIIGSGGREHALGWKIAQNPYVTGVMYVGGNAGTSKEYKSLGNFEALTFDDIYRLIVDHKIDLVIPGSENLLNEGFVDFLHNKGYHNVFGPTREAAQIEADKFFSYSLMAAAHIPQASGVCCHSKEEITEAIDWISSDGVVLKARGLTGGKGVSVFTSKEEALQNVDQFVLKYGSSNVLVSERLKGQEFSAFAVCKGKKITPFPFLIQDYKRLEEGDKGPNTGGMGGHTLLLDYPNLVNTVAKKIMEPVVEQLEELGYPYCGFLYAGMMLLPNGELRVLEFNCRFGDPECQIAMVSLYSDLFEIIQNTLIGLPTTVLQHPGSTCCVVLTTKDYPQNTLKLGMPINLPKDLSVNSAKSFEFKELQPFVKIFHAGTSSGEDGSIRVAGGRVLNIVSYADNLSIAQSEAYQLARRISLFYNSGLFHYRPDIGFSY